MSAIFSNYTNPTVMMRINWPIFVHQPDIFLPILYLRAMGFPIPLLYPPIIFQNPKCYHLPLFIRMREWNISHTLWLHNIMTPPHYSHSKRCHPYHSSFPHQRSSLIHYSNQSTRLHHDELGLSSLSESFTSNDQDTTAHSIFNATPVTVHQDKWIRPFILFQKNKVIYHFLCPLIILSILLL